MLIRHLRTVLQTWLIAIALLFLKWTQGKALIQDNEWNNPIVFCIQSHRKKNCCSLRISSAGYVLGTAATEQICGSTLCSSHICLFSFYLVHLSLCWQWQSVDYDSVPVGPLLITNTYLPFNSSPKRRFPVYYWESGKMQAPSGGQNDMSMFLQAFAQRLSCWGAKMCALHFEVIWP